MKPGGPAVWGESFQGAVGTHAAPGYAHPVGVFHSEFGLLNRRECDVAGGLNEHDILALSLIFTSIFYVNFCPHGNLKIVYICTPVHVMWWYESADHRSAVRHKAHSDARVVSAGNIYVHRMSFPTA